MGFGHTADRDGENRDRIRVTTAVAVVVLAPLPVYVLDMGALDCSIAAVVVADAVAAKAVGTGDSYMVGDVDNVFVALLQPHQLANDKHREFYADNTGADSMEAVYYDSKDAGPVVVVAVVSHQLLELVLFVVAENLVAMPHNKYSLASMTLWCSVAVLARDSNPY